MHAWCTNPSSWLIHRVHQGCTRCSCCRAVKINFDSSQTPAKYCPANEVNEPSKCPARRFGGKASSFRPSPVRFTKRWKRQHIYKGAVPTSFPHMSGSPYTSLALIPNGSNHTKLSHPNKCV